MIKNKNIKIADKEYIINGIDAITSIAIMPTFQRVAMLLLSLTKTDAFEVSGSPHIIVKDFKHDLEQLLLHSSILREIYDVSKEGNPLARDVTHSSQLPPEISDIGYLIQEIGAHLYGYTINIEDEPKKK